MEPFGHGLTGEGPDGLPIFENATVVGHCSRGYVETLTVNGEDRRVCVAEGELDEMRYPKFVQWLEGKLEENDAKGSVEVVGLPENGNKIIYEGGWKEKGRVPAQYGYSGYAILGAKRGADATAVVVELNEQNEKNREGIMDEKRILDEFKDIKDKIAEIAKSGELNESLVAANAEIATLKALLDEERGNLKELNAKEHEAWEAASKERDEAWAKIAVLEESIAAKQIAEKLAEMNAAIAPYTDEQKAVAQAEIDAFTADPAKVEINAIVGKICVGIVQKAREDEKAAAAEAASHEQNAAGDVFSPVYVPESKGSSGNSAGVDGLY
jgi:hypothetical protein